MRIINLKEIDLNRIFVDVLIFFPLTSSVGQLIPFSLNRLLLVVLIATLLLQILQNGKIHKESAAILLGVLFFSLNGLLLTTDISLNLENCIYWFVTILLMLYISYYSNRAMIRLELIRKEKAIKIITIIVIAINIAGLLFPENYENTGAYVGFMVTSHSVASTMIMNLALLLYCARNWIHLFLTLGCTFFVFIAEARTFLLPLAVILYFELRCWLRNAHYRRLLMMVMCIVAVIALPYTSVGKKFVDTLNNPYARDWLSGLTNFRSTLWEGDIAAFIQENWYRKLLGNGFSLTYQLHEKLYGVKIWSHNDFFNLLIATGLCGLLEYCYILFGTLYKLHRQHRNKFYSFLFFLFVFVSAFFNGFYLYIALVFAFSIMVAHPLFTKGNNQQLLKKEPSLHDQNRNIDNSFSL